MTLDELADKLRELDETKAAAEEYLANAVRGRIEPRNYGARRGRCQRLIRWE
jgi:hypothetical protein